MTQLKSNTSSIPVNENLEAQFDSTFNAFRIFVGQYPDLNTVSFYLNEDGQIFRIGDLRNGPDAATLAEIESVGILKEGSLTQYFGITATEIEQARHAQRERDIDLQRLQRDELGTLPPIYNFRGNVESTVTVLQGQGHFINPEGSLDGLYTFGAGPCSIVITVAKSASEGKVVNVGMAHVDANTPEESLVNYLTQSKIDDDNSLEIYVISGEDHTALTINSAIEATGLEITFANIDQSGDRSDAAAVDVNGNVFYGENMSLVNIDQSELRMITLMRQLPNQPLILKQHE